MKFKAKSYYTSLIKYLNNRINNLDKAIVFYDEKMSQSDSQILNKRRNRVVSTLHDVNRLYSSIDSIYYNGINEEFLRVIPFLTKKELKEYKKVLKAINQKILDREIFESHKLLQKLGIVDTPIKVGSKKQLLTIDASVKQLGGIKKKDKLNVAYDEKTFNDTIESIKKEVAEKIYRLVNSGALQRHITNKIGRNKDRIIELESQTKLLKRQVGELSLFEMKEIRNFITNIINERKLQIKRNNVELNKIVSIGELREQKKEAEIRKSLSPEELAIKRAKLDGLVNENATLDTLTEGEREYVDIIKTYFLDDSFPYIEKEKVRSL